MKKIITRAGALGLASIIFVTGCSPQESDKESPKSAATEQKASNELPWVATKNTTRINTSDPLKAATLVSQTLWTSTTEQNRPNGVVLVNPDDWRTAAASTDLIHFPNNGPVLFTNKNQVPEVTINELKRLKPKGSKENNGVQVILIGDLDKKVQNQIEDAGFKTDRIEAKNPADYAKAIDTYYAKVSGSLPQSVVIGSMDSPEFTLPAVNWISHMPEPLLYVKKDQIPQETIDALKKRNGKANIYLLGPDAAVSGTVETQLGQYGKVVRISGEDPYSNAIAFAKYKDNATQFGWGITTPGHNVSLIPSGSKELAIAAAPFSHAGKHAPLIWSDKEKMPSSVMSYVMSIQPKYKMSPSEGPYNHAWLTGDKKDFSKAAQAELDDMLEIVPQSGKGHGGMNMGGMNMDGMNMDGMEDTGKNTDEK